MISAPLALASPGNLVNVTNAADSLTISGGVSGVGGLTKTGSGTLVLAAATPTPARQPSAAASLR